MTTQPKTISVTGLQPSSTYEVWVRATNVAKGGYSDWSSKYTVKVVGDNTPPNTPAAPQVFVIPQGIRVRCSGNDSSGNPLAMDIAYYEVWQVSPNIQIGTVPAAIPGLGLNSEATFPVDAPSAVSKSFYVIAVDKSGNKSAQSVSVASASIPVFSDAYISNLSADKITTGTLQANQVINVGSTGNNITIQSLGSTSPYSKLYKGTGTYNNSNTPFYVDGLGKFSLGSNLYFDGTGNLSITGAITATSGSFTGSITSVQGNIGGFTIASDRLYGTGDSAGTGLSLYPYRTYMSGLSSLGAFNAIGDTRRMSIDADNIQVVQGSFGGTLRLNQWGGQIITGGLANSNMTINGNLTVTGSTNFSSASFSSLSVGTLSVSNDARVDNLNAQYLNGNVAGDFVKIAGDATIGGSKTFSETTFFSGLIGITSNTRLSGSGWRPNSTNSSDLGNSTYLWRDLYRAGSTYTSSDVRLKTEIQDSDLGLSFINSIRPVKYKWSEVKSIEQNEEESRVGVRYHYGFIAQEIKNIAPEDFAGWALSDKNDPSSLQMIVFEEFISPMVKAIQELSEENNLMKERLAILEAKS